MRILKIDKAASWFEVVPDSFDDLWHLEKLIDAGDIVAGTAERKIKPQNEGDKAFREIVYVEIEAEKAVFHEATNQLRIQGKVVAVKPEELIPLKAHHTLEAEVGKKIRVVKKALKGFHIERLERAKAATGREKILLVIMDDEAADLAFLKDTGLETRARIKAEREGKRFKAEKAKGSPYYEELLAKIAELKPAKLVIAGPGFEKQNFEKYLKGKPLKIRPIFESTDSTGITGMNEIVKSGKLDRILHGMHSAEEAKAVERVLAALGNEMASVGLKEVGESLKAGAVEEFMIDEKLLSEKRREAEEMLDMAEKYGAKIIFVSGIGEAGKQLAGLGGVAALLRYRKKWN